MRLDELPRDDEDEGVITATDDGVDDDEMADNKADDDCAKLTRLFSTICTGCCCCCCKVGMTFPRVVRIRDDGVEVALTVTALV